MENFGIGSWLQRRRPKSGSKIALIFGDRELSYEEFAERSDRLANALKAGGVTKGDRVAYLGDNHPAFLETLIACGQLGAIFLPLNTRLAPPEITFQLEDCGAVVLIHSANLNGLAASGAEGTRVGRRIVVGDSRPGESPAALATAGSEIPTAVEDYEEVVASGASRHLDEEIGLDDGAMILYTSGTTGRPKGALLTHGNITWNCINVIVDFDFSSADVALMISPMFHVASLDMGVLPTLLKGGTVVLESRFDPQRTLELIEQHRATTISGVPTTYQMLCEHPAWPTSDLGSLNKLTCGGSAVPMRVLEAYEARGLRFSNGYGMTETAPGATTLPADRSRDKAGSSGLPHFFSDVRIADIAGGVAEQGEVGEIQIKGPNVIHEYWNRPDATAESYADGGWFKSGDMGYKDADGFVFVSDRLKDMIISGGENIYPVEVEQAISELDAVGSVAVIGVPDEKWGEVPRAVVVLREGAFLTEDELKEHLAGRLARYKIPKTVVFVDDMPRTASGKIRKSELRRSTVS
ncbi:o-succinylbenzoate--CoA ligase [Arthrobacter bambusae]|uniref:o-succinylbenzoate--CoA ligase n=1 Tax=Arthrobacter bambusae TaxID=1338426 RepID=UPI0027843AFB|nr:o-succinylbenzoate--CoA ligase [Arthrobacter bambusae]MDQ0030121.1 fatty-acyl-CoA synthase [Arthrobacter bambusae]MDQ0097804.1 fatty-acyl-CoA synthase [Arthrobacter bambusae]